MPAIVVRAPLRQSRLQREDRRAPIQRLNLALCIDAEHQRAIGGSKYKPTMPRTLSTNSGSFESLNVSTRSGCLLAQAQRSEAVATPADFPLAGLTGPEQATNESIESWVIRACERRSTINDALGVHSTSVSLQDIAEILKAVERCGAALYTGQFLGPVANMWAAHI